MNKDSKTAPIIIKKYSNRRLYNTEISNYITLEDLFLMVKKNVDFIVYDAKTGEDLTKNVLTQIIFEQEAKGYSLLPVGFLKQVISYYGNNLSDIVPHYLETTMQNFVSNQEQMKDLFADSWQSFSPLKFYEEVGKQNFDILKNTFEIFSKNVLKTKNEGKE